MSRSSPRRFLRPVLALLVWLAAGPAARSQEPDPSARILHPGDALLVRIENVGGGLPEYREIIDSDGKIEMPYLGMFAAAGKSLATVETEMAAAYADSRLSTDARVRITLVTHFDPPPDRETLIRAADPRLPVPAGEAFPPPGPALDFDDR